MEAAAGAFGVIGESIVFLDHFKDLPDPRQRGKITCGQRGIGMEPPGRRYGDAGRRPTRL
jgi:hypothetical protein